MIRVVGYGALNECDHCGNRAVVEIATRRQGRFHTILMCKECRVNFGEELKDCTFGTEYESLPEEVNSALGGLKHIDPILSTDRVGEKRREF